MSRPAASSQTRPTAAPVRLSRVAGLLIAAAFLGVLIITLAHPGATRMHAAPWSSVYAGALLLPALALLVRAFDPRQPLVVPTAGWSSLTWSTAVLIALSSTLSPYRGPAWLGAAPLLSALAVFLLAFDWLHREPAFPSARRDQIRQGLLLAYAAVAIVSLALWFGQVGPLGGGEVLAVRNLFPLGHPNYTAGIALLILPTSLLLVQRRRGRWQIVAAAMVVLALLLLFTSGSRGGLIGLAVVAFAAWLMAPLSRRRKWQFALVGVAAALVFGLAHPRTRAMLQPEPPGAAPNLSNVQRQAMLVAGARMGSDRPLLGWGPGTTPLAYPRYRASLEGGAENVLQLHSLPVQIWAEFGGAGVVAALVLASLLIRSAGRDPTGAATLAGYVAFALTDWQLDVPIFATTLAIFAALLAPPPNPGASARASRWTGLAVVACLIGFVLGASPDPTPGLNVRALALARDPTRAATAAELFEESLRLNPDQEIAHFNLGWLRVVSAPLAAEHHFLAALHLVPDKGGVYFGLGLARLNQGRTAAAIHALAMECLNDPAFLTSPWWREPALGAHRGEVAAELKRLLESGRAALPPGGWAAGQAATLAASTAQVGEVPAGPERSYRRERTGYPVLMRDLDLPTPVDLFDVREAGAGGASANLPPKGWLPSPLLLTLLDSPPTTTKP